MKIKIFSIFVIFLALKSSSAQDASCMYVNSTVGYACYLTMNNPTGAEVSEIGGEHLEGFSDVDVVLVNAWQGRSSIVPQVICAQFPNLIQLDFSFFGVTLITENSFSLCTNAEMIRLWFNQITSVPTNAFANNRALR